MEANLADWTDKLITGVQKRPALYNNKLREFTDRPMKEQLWQEVTESVIPNWCHLTPEEKIHKVREVQNRWQNLRTCFKRELKAQKRDLSTPIMKRRRKYVYFDQLSFLLTCYDESDTDIYPISMPEHFDIKTEPFLEDVNPESDMRSIYSANEQSSEEPFEEHQAGSFRMTNHFQYMQETRNFPTDGSVSEDNERDSLKAHERNTQHFVVTEGKGKNYREDHEKSSEKRVGNEQTKTDAYSMTHRQKRKTMREAEENGVDDELDERIIHSRKNHSNNILSYFEESVVSILKQKINEDVDEDKAFLLSLLPMFKKFNDDQKLDAKTEILRVMRRVKNSVSESATHM